MPRSGHFLDENVFIRDNFLKKIFIRQKIVEKFAEKFYTPSEGRVLSLILQKRAAKKRVMGIEPTYPAWKAGVLPLNYTREQNV